MKKIWISIMLLGMAKQATSQQVDLKLSSYGGQPTITAISSITLQNGFVIPTGSNVRLYISNTVNVGSLPSNTQNYILTRKFKKEGVNLLNIDNERSIFEENQTISYFDGLGRLIQKIDLKASPAYRDVVSYKEYDEYGRESKLYEPYADNLSNDGSFKTNVKQQQLDFYSATTGWDDSTPKTTKPFSVISFDLSAFGRTLEQGAVGEHWQPFSSEIANSGHTVKKSYENNIENEVKFWFPSVGGADGTEYYLRGRLKKNITKDENWIAGKQGTIENFIDDNGQTVLKRIWETETKKLDTYYVYDDFGALSYVIPPGFTGNTIDENTTDFFELIYAYRYDDKRRLVEKKMPGKGWEYLIYNRGDRVILTQDANQRSAKKWSYIKYDAFGKVVSSGIYTNSIINQTTRVQVQALADAVSVQYESRNGATTYTNASFPSTLSQLQELIVNYYDDYKFKPVTTLAAGNGIDSTYLVKGLLTGIKVSREDGSYPLMSVNYYDRYGRIVEIVADNNLSGVDRTANTYDFTGKLLTSNRQHSINGTNSVTKILTTNNYDHVDRLVQIKKKINEQDEVIQSRLAYNEIGQLKTKSLHSENGGGNFMTSIGYTYNERGWQTKASSAQFTSQLNYNVNGTTVLANAQYNGNIAQQMWGYAATTGNTFTYAYDALNRLMSGVSTGTVMSEVLTYDDMGNIKTLVRDNGTAITYNYNNANKGNRLASLSGGLTGGFTYDLNGNATKDRTGMILSYNYLNLPKTVSGTGKSIAYTYDASGAKLNRKSTVGGITTEQDYISGIEYIKANGANPVIERIATEDGFLLNSSGNYSYYYNLTDHLGNVRVVLKKDGTSTAPVATVMQKQDYYPFGKTKSIATSINNKYLYNGKEMQTDLNGGTHTLGASYVLEGQLDYGARFYDAEIGRWNVLDPLQEDEYWSAYDDTYAKELSNLGYDVDLAEGRVNAGNYFSLLGPRNVITADNSAVHYNSSPYAYVLNNPLSFIDPMGLDTTKTLQEVTVTDYKKINPWGPSLIMLGQPVLPKDGVIVKYFYGHALAVGKNKSTSVASLASRVTVRTIEKKAGDKVAKAIGKKTASLIFKRLGGLLGRAIPVAGWAITSTDLWEFRKEIAAGAKAFSMGGGDYYKLQADPKNGWMYIK
ncbi:DUF6443 domain-containing protein [Sphingobacterium sp. 2149]|uniref:DUF6443 domain-containing protein n=1 Tax=Sphingobacterium sp. 2149 TaxID=2817763 RepID=UPI001AE3466C|nr:DUF6443 domain-containing protein [Sphingobacterium sp. 2149]MDR6734844.1 hypothetical protein [Sphingobacterium sp. 2149]